MGEDSGGAGGAVGEDSGGAAVFVVAMNPALSNAVGGVQVVVSGAVATIVVDDGAGVIALRMTSLF